MLAKIGLVITSIALAMVAMGRFENVARHGGFSESTVWAQESDGAEDASSPDDNASQADAASQDDQAIQNAGHKSVCKVCGNYSGQIISNSLGTGTIMLGIIPGRIPFRSKVIGTWIDSFDNTPGFLKGSANSNGGVSLQFRLKAKGHCLFKFHGTFENGNEISGTYSTNGCIGPSDSGTIDITE